MKPEDIEAIKFDQNGLIPAIIQDFYTKKVLTLAYMNAESLRLSIEKKQTHFFSRSRKELWHKGETSGNTQTIVSIAKDCDSDTLLVQVIPKGPACHKGDTTCFNQYIHNEQKKSFAPQDLYNIVLDRKNNPKEGSYTSYLFEKGQDKILKKIGEEAAEVIIAAKNNDKTELSNELADLMYHITVLMVEQGLKVADVANVLAQRHE